jgi:hypothetical protein
MSGSVFDVGGNPTEYNPASGLPMSGSVFDVGGNPYGWSDD